ncbi:MAG: beta strand repeat-containing protein, partial [Ilumatobacteraceae bacterium]
MAIKFDTFASTGGGGGGAVDSVNGDTGAVIVTLDGVTDQGATTTNSITVGGVTIGTEYSLPTIDGTSGQALTTDGAGTLTFNTITGAVSSVNTQTGAVVLSANDLAADHTATNYTAANSNIDGHLSGIDTKLGTIAAGLTYKGTFNATAGTPDLSSAIKGDLYIVNTAGTIYGQTWAVGDHLLINEDMGGTITNSKIDKIDNTDAVSSVNTQTGAVVLSANDLAADHTATNYTAANSNIDGHLSGIDTKLASQIESGDNISLFTNDAGYLTDITGESIADLSDVTITTAINGQVLSYNGSAWVNSAASAGSLAGLSDTTITAPADGEYLRYNGSSWVDAALSVVDDTSPQLGGALDTNGNAITSASNADVSINPNGTGNISIGADLVPDADATHTIGSEDNRYITTHSDLNGAVRFKAKNDEGAAITAGQALYIKGLAGDGTTPTVGLADANDASKMPAFGLAFAGANDQAEVQVVSFGNLGGLNTSTFSVGDTLYISTTAGALTATKPTGETSQLQNIGRVVRSNNGDGIINVGGAGRSAATPNLDQDKIFLGNASNQSVSTALSAIGLSKFNNDAGYLTGITGESIGDLSDVTITTATNGQVLSYNGSAWVNAAASANSLAGLSDVTITAASTGEVLRYNGSVWVDATLAYSDLSGTPTNVSTFTNDAGYLTGITGESIGDLSDVTITSASTGEVLRYNGSAWVDATLAYSDLSGTPTNVSTFTNDAGYLTGITGESIGDLSDVTITTATNGQVL